jgi:hypothetical protein
VIAGIYELSKPDELKIGPKEFQQILNDLKTFETKVATVRSAITDDARTLAVSVKKQLESWKGHEKGKERRCRSRPQMGQFWAVLVRMANRRECTR